MSFSEISSRGGITTTNFTCIQNILLSNYMSQYDLANIDSMLQAAVDTTSKEREEKERS